MNMPSKRQFCGHCVLPVMKHRQSAGIHDGTLWHKKCRAKHLKKMKKEKRRRAANAERQARNSQGPATTLQC